MERYILAIDQGTTGSTALLVSESSFDVKGKYNTEFPQIFPKPGWVEHNTKDIWQSVRHSIAQVLSDNNIKAEQISCIGITNQRETTCALNLQGEALYNAIVWQDRRTSDFCQNIKNTPLGKKITHKTGLPVDPYFSASKMNWLLHNVDSIKKAALNNELRFATIDTFILLQLTNQKSYKTDATNASRTLLMNIENGQWDKGLCETFDVPMNCLPEIADSIGKLGLTEGLDFLPDGIPICSILGDQQAALFGQACTQEGQLKCTYGTGSFVLANTGNKLIRSANGLITTIAYRHQGQDAYALEGCVYVTGASVQWLRDQLQFFPDSSHIETLANEVNSLEEMEHLIFLPFFSGIGSPYWLPEAKAMICGLTRDSSRKHIARACLEGIALSIDDLLSAFQEENEQIITEMRVDGGAAANRLLMQFQSNFSKINIIRPKVLETTSYGAALGAAIGASIICFQDFSKNWKQDIQIRPEDSNLAYFQKKKEKWLKIIKRFYVD